MTPDEKINVLAKYSKQLSDSIRESDLQKIMMQQEIDRLRILLEELKIQHGRTGVLIALDDDDCIVVCGPTSDETLVCAKIADILLEKIAERRRKAEEAE
jgi:hypothetical protein